MGGGATPGAGGLEGESLPHPALAPAAPPPGRRWPTPSQGSPCGADSSPVTPEPRSISLGSAAWRRGLRSPSICSPNSVAPFGEVGLCGEIVKREGAGAQRASSTLHLMLSTSCPEPWGKAELGSEFLSWEHPLMSVCHKNQKRRRRGGKEPALGTSGEKA